MTDESKPNEGAEVKPSEGLPNPTFDKTETVPLGPGLETLQKQIETLTKEVRGIQGDKDRTGKKVDDLNQQIARITELSKDGRSESEIRRELLLDRILESGALPIQQAGGTAIGGGGKTETPFNVMEELKKYPVLDSNDPDVRKAVSGNYESPVHLQLELANLAYKKAKPLTPSDTGVTPPIGGKGSSTIDDAEKEKIGAKLIDLMSEPTKNKAEIARLSKLLKGE